MNATHSSATPRCEYQPTIIETRLLIERLATQIKFLQKELKRSWTDFKTNPRAFAARSTHDLVRFLKQSAATPKTVSACSTAILAVTSMVIIACFVDRTPFRATVADDSNKLQLELLVFDAGPPPDSRKEGTGRASARVKGIGGGGDRDPLPPQFGKLPPPSLIPAPIPKAPPINAQSLPVAGINIDPAQWIDVKAPVYGDPESKSRIPSSGPGTGGGIGTGTGPGIGSERSGGYGCTVVSQGIGGIGTSCRGGGGGSSTFKASQVDQRARLLSKPEPQYTEEARRNQITGTVMLRVVFSNLGEVNQIQAVRTLPFGLTERAIAAARQIKFVPAMKGGQPVSVQMQLEYNFNLY